MFGGSCRSRDRVGTRLLLFGGGAPTAAVEEFAHRADAVIRGFIVVTSMGFVWCISISTPRKQHVLFFSVFVLFSFVRKGEKTKYSNLHTGEYAVQRPLVRKSADPVVFLPA